MTSRNLVQRIPSADKNPTQLSVASLRRVQHRKVTTHKFWWQLTSTPPKIGHSTK